MDLERESTLAAVLGIVFEFEGTSVRLQAGRPVGETLIIPVRGRVLD